MDWFAVKIYLRAEFHWLYFTSLRRPNTRSSKHKIKHSPCFTLTVRFEYRRETVYFLTLYLKDKLNEDKCVPTEKYFNFFLWRFVLNFMREANVLARNFSRLPLKHTCDCGSVSSGAFSSLGCGRGRGFITCEKSYLPQKVCAPFPTEKSQAQQ